jgi:hypothetical protein
MRTLRKKSLREQRKIRLPAGWYERLEEVVHARGWNTIDDFCEDPNDLKDDLRISVRTLERSRGGTNPTMTMAKFDVLRQKLEVATRADLLDLLRPAEGDTPTSGPVAGPEGSRSPAGSGGVAVPGHPQERVFMTQQNLPQWADHCELALGHARLEEVSCWVETDSPYFRFGFKVMTEAGRLFGDAAIISQDPNLLVHIGRNNWDRTNPPITSQDIFFTWSENGIRRGKDVRLFASEPRFGGAVRMTIDAGNIVEFLVNGQSCLKVVIPPEIRRRIALFAWGDNEEFEVRVRDIKVRTIPIP